MHPVAQLGVPGGMELMMILGIAVLLFGANKLPRLARSSGQAIGEFKRGRDELEQELRDAATPTATDPENGEGTETESEERAVA